MALSDLWTGAQIESAVRRELMDPTGTTAWSWNTIELQVYINDWQNLLQDRFEFVWGTASRIMVGGTSTIQLTSVATDMLRLGNIWWNGYRLAARAETKKRLRSCSGIGEHQCLGYLRPCTRMT